MGKIKRDSKGRFSKGNFCEYGFKKGHVVSDKIREKISDTMKKKYIKPITCGTAPRTAFKKNDVRLIGKSNPMWNGGKTKIRKLISSIGEYLKWRAEVFKRDNYHCQKCGEKGYLEAHHIIPVSVIIREFNIKNIQDARNCKELWDIGNGISYCKECHSSADKFRRIKMEVTSSVVVS